MQEDVIEIVSIREAVGKPWLLCAIAMI